MVAKEHFGLYTQMQMQARKSGLEHTGENGNDRTMGMGGRGPRPKRGPCNRGSLEGRMEAKCHVLRHQSPLHEALDPPLKPAIFPGSSLAQTSNISQKAGSWSALTVAERPWCQGDAEWARLGSI